MMRFLLFLTLILSAAACSRDTDTASLAIAAAANQRGSDWSPSSVAGKEPQLHIEQLPSRSAGVVAVNAGGGRRIDFQLTDTAGELTTLVSFKGRLVVMFFGATRCEQACPNAIARLHRVEANLGARPSQVAFVMISTDGDRDTADSLHQFVTHFSPNMIGLTGSPGAVRALAGQYDITLTEHSANNHENPIVVLDGHGKWRQTIAGDTDAGELSQALRPLLDELQTSLTQNTR